MKIFLRFLLSFCLVFESLYFSAVFANNSNPDCLKSIKEIQKIRSVLEIPPSPSKDFERLFDMLADTTKSTYSSLEPLLTSYYEFAYQKLKDIEQSDLTSNSIFDINKEYLKQNPLFAKEITEILIKEIEKKKSELSEEMSQLFAQVAPSLSKSAKKVTKEIKEKEENILKKEKEFLLRTIISIFTNESFSLVSVNEKGENIVPMGIVDTTIVTLVTAVLSNLTFNFVDKIMTRDLELMRGSTLNALLDSLFTPNGYVVLTTVLLYIIPSILKLNTNKTPLLEYYNNFLMPADIGVSFFCFTVFGLIILAKVFSIALNFGASLSHFFDR